MKTRSRLTKSRTTLSRRRFLQATALTGAAAAIGPRAANAAGGKVVVGTWGGDYQNLIQKNIAAPLLQPDGIEVIYDTRAVSVFGRYWFANDWAVSAESISRDPGGVWRPQDFRIGVQRRF